MNTFYFVVKNKLTGMIENVHRYEVDKTQEEIAKIAEDFNNSGSSKDFVHEQVFDDGKKALIDFALKWKSDKEIDDIVDKLEDIEDDVRSVLSEVQWFIKKQKNNGLEKRI